MKKPALLIALILITLLAVTPFSFAQHTQNSGNQAIEFPDIPGYRTLKCDLHMHTIFSDGSVWPNIRVQEAILDGLDAISITDHIEHQPHSKDIPNPDLNRSYELALQAALGSELIVINGVEITRDMPPGHANAIFVQDANKLNQKDVMDVFQEAGTQGAFVFWNHPHWTSQQPDGVATLNKMHLKLISEGLIHGIEIFNHLTYSQEALQIANDHHLTILGNSDIHGPLDWKYEVHDEGHRPVTLVFAAEKNEKALHEALEKRKTVVWFDNTLVGDAEFLVPLIEHSLVMERQGKSLVQGVILENRSDACYILENRSEYTLHNQASVFILKPHERTLIQVKTLEPLDSFKLHFGVLNAFTTPQEHPEIEIEVLSYPKN